MTQEQHFDWLWSLEANLGSGQMAVCVMCRNNISSSEHSIDLLPLIDNWALWHLPQLHLTQTASVPFQALLKTYSFCRINNQDIYEVQTDADKTSVLRLENPVRRRLLVWRTNDTLDMLVFWNWYERNLLRVQYGGHNILPVLAKLDISSNNANTARAFTHVFEHGKLHDEKLES